MVAYVLVELEAFVFAPDGLVAQLLEALLVLQVAQADLLESACVETVMSVAEAVGNRAPAWKAVLQ